MKLLFYPFAFALSWWFWAAGHIGYLIMERHDNKLWIDVWFPIYQSNMLASSFFQELVNGRGRFWPWGDQWQPDDQ